MLGRAAYHNPGLLADVDAAFFGTPWKSADWERVIGRMAAYADRHIAAGGRLAHVARHMVGLFHGMAGARRWRQVLSQEAVRPGAGGQVLFDAFAQLRLPEAEAA